MDGVQRSPTFLVGTDRQRGILDEFQRRDQQFSEAYQKNKPLCFNARAYQKTHPGKAQLNHKDADATLASPMLLGVADGVSQLEEFGLDASELPNELLATCEELAISQLIPDGPVSPQDLYRGPVSLLKDAYEATESLGSTTVLLAILDNMTRIHGKLHPMVAVLSIGDCELLMLRRMHGPHSPLQAVFHTEMQRIEGNVQTPLQLARVDERIDADFDESLAIEVIERGSAVHCISAYEGDVLVMGSDGVFDNLFLDEIIAICNSMLRPTTPQLRSMQMQHSSSSQKLGTFFPAQTAVLEQAARRIVAEAHGKCGGGYGGASFETPIGRGGKADDTSVVVGEVVEWTQRHNEIWAEVRRKHRWNSLLSCGNLGLNSCSVHTCQFDKDDSDSEKESRNPSQRNPTLQARTVQPTPRNQQMLSTPISPRPVMSAQVPQMPQPMQMPHTTQLGSTSKRPPIRRPVVEEQKPRPMRTNSQRMQPAGPRSQGRVPPRGRSSDEGDSWTDRDTCNTS